MGLLGVTHQEREERKLSGHSLNTVNRNVILTVIPCTRMCGHWNSKFK